MANSTNRCGGIMKDKVLKAGQTAGQILRRERLMVDKSFDMKSEKPKNKKNYSKANDYNTDKYDQSATQSNINFKKNSLEEFADNPHNRAAKKDNPMFDKKGPSVLYKKYCRK